MSAQPLPVSPVVRRTTAVHTTVLRHALRHTLAHRGLQALAVGTLVLTEGILQLTGSADRTLATLLDLVLFVVPLVTLMYGIIAWHANREFTELVLAQPVRRRAVFLSAYLSLVLPLAGALALGMMLPLAVHRAIDPGAVSGLLALVGSSIALIFIFGGLALWIGIRIDDRLRAVTAGLIAWLALTIGYDAVVLLVSTTFADASLERPMLAMMLANPVDLARSFIVLHSDAAALMGYTGAVLHRFLGTALGSVAALGGLLLWIITPVVAGMRAFARRDF